MPADVYARSARVYRGLDALAYPFHDATFTVTQCGRICFKARKVNLSRVFAGQNVGVPVALTNFGLLRRRDAAPLCAKLPFTKDSDTHTAALDDFRNSLIRQAVVGRRLEMPFEAVEDSLRTEAHRVVIA